MNTVVSTQPASLMPFVGCPRKSMPEGLPFHCVGHVQLLDWTGRQLRSDRRGAVDTRLPDTLARLNINLQQWLVMSQHFEIRFRGLIGAVAQLQIASRVFERAQIANINAVLPFTGELMACIKSRCCWGEQPNCQRSR